MQRYYLIAAMLAVSIPFHSLRAQTNPTAVDAGTNIPADPHAPVDSDSPEDIARDATRDLRDNRFYNKPGATRAQYEADWQRCRLIARGSRTPSGTVPTYFYNPNVSPLAAGVGGAIGSAIAMAIIEGQQRRANRRACLLINGWRHITLPPEATKRVRGMTDSERSTYFDSIVGSEQVEGTKIERTSFFHPSDSALQPDAPIVGSPSLFLGRKIDPAIPFDLASGEAAIVVAFRRADAGSAGRSANVALARYDRQNRDLVYQPTDWKKKGDTTTYSLAVDSHNRKAPLEVHVLRITPGDYAISSTAFSTSNCFGAPVFNVREGEVAYLGDFTPYQGVKLSTGSRFYGTVYSAHPEEVRQALSAQQARLAGMMTMPKWQNGATYACSAVTMDRWDLPGIETIARLPQQIQGAGEVAPASQ